MAGLCLGYVFPVGVRQNRFSALNMYLASQLKNLKIWNAEEAHNQDRLLQHIDDNMYVKSASLNLQFQNSANLTSEDTLIHSTAFF